MKIHHSRFSVLFAAVAMAAFSAFAVPAAETANFMDPKLWGGIAGQAPEAPKVEAVDSEYGKAVRFTSVSDGKYQRFQLNLPEAVDMSKVAALTFDLRQTVRPGKPTDFRVQFQYQPSIGIAGTVNLDPKGEWTHVTLPVDLAKMDGGRQKPAFGMAKAVEFSFFSAFERKGQLAEIANVVFVMKEAAPAPTANQSADDLKYMDPALWSGIKSQAPEAPQIEAVDSARGKAIRITAITDGKYQMFELKLPEAVDMSKVAALTFDLRQTIRPGKPTALWVKFNYTAKSGIAGTVNLNPKAEWTHVTLPIDLRSMNGGTQNSASFGMAQSITFSFFSAFESKGQLVEIANVHLVMKDASGNAAKEIPVVSYHHRNAPDSGDASGKVLTDGRVEDADQAYYRVYSHEPEIEFDLGAFYLVNEIRLASVAVPSQNISDYTVFASRDGKEWTTAAHVTNTNDSAEKITYAITGKDLKALGRYFRIHATRSRVDFPLHIAEVTFIGKLPTDAEIADAMQGNYDLGPALPEVNAANDWELTSGDAVLHVDRKTGIVTRYEHGKQRLAERIFGRYELSDGKTKIITDDYAAQVVKGAVNGNTLTVDFTLPKLSGITFQRTFTLQNGELATKLAFTSQRTDKQVFFTASEVVLPQTLRNGGLYESWGAGHTVQHKFAAEVPFSYPADTGPVTVFEQPSLPRTLLHFRYKYDDRYVQIGSGVVTIAGFGDKRTIFTATGWILGDGLFELSPQKPAHSVESRLSDTPGDLTAAFDRYLDLPEVQQFRSRIKRPQWLKNMRFYASQEWDGYWGTTNLRQAAFYDSTIREGNFILADCNIDFYWGDYPTSGIVRNVFNGTMTAEECSARALEMHRIAPKLKLSEYTWLWSAMDTSEVYKKHPDWFITHNAEGQEINFFPGWHLNYYRLVGIPESRQEMIDAISRFLDFYHLDVWYLDGGGSPSSIDWPTLRVDEPDAWDNVYLGIREAIRKNDPERLVGFNNPENPIADFGFLESFGGVLTTDWRDGATWMYRFKLWQRRDPLYSPMYIYWIAGVDQALRRYVVGTGLLPALHTGDPDERRDVAYVSAEQQSRPARLVNANISPNWRYNKDTPFETMPLSFGESGWLFIANHAKDPQSDTFALDAAALGLNDPAQPLYQWRFDLIVHKNYRGLLTEPEQEKNYRTSRWQSDFVLQPHFLGVTPYTARPEQKMSVGSDRLALWYLTQSPAVVYSVDGMRNQILLSNTLGVKVSGKTAENAITLTVDSARKEAEIIAVLPEGRSAAGVTVNGKAAAFEPLFFGNARFVLIPVAQGQSEIAVSLKAAEKISASGIKITANAPKPGEMLNVTASGTAPDAPVTAALYNGEELVWSAPLFQNAAQTAIPTGVTGGQYKLHLIDPAGNTLAQAPLTLATGRPAVPRFANADQAVTTHSEKANPFVLADRGIEGLRAAVQLEEANYKADIAADDAKITLESLPRYATHWNCSAAAQELKVKRYLKVQLDGTFGWYHREGPTPGQKGLSPRYDKPDAFCGLTFDFGTPQGYTVRTLGGIGMLQKERRSPAPQFWGTKATPQNIYSISNLAVSTRDSETLWLDLCELGAPADWDGRLWFGVLLQYLSPNHRFTVTLLESCDTLPPGVQPANVFPVRGGKKASDLTVSVLPVLNEPAPVLDAKLDEPAWRNALKIDRYYRSGDPLEQPPATVLKIWADAKNLYFGVELSEPRASGFTIDPANKPWFVDGFEFYFRSTAEAPRYVQYIVNGSNTYFAERFTDEKPGSPRTRLAAPHYKSAVNGKVMTIEGAIPLADLGPAPWRFIVRRNRIIDGSCHAFNHIPSLQQRDFNGAELRPGK